MFWDHLAGGRIMNRDFSAFDPWHPRDPGFRSGLMRNLDLRHHGGGYEMDRIP
jgi:hypothetical protein